MKLQDQIKSYIEMIFDENFDVDVGNLLAWMPTSEIIKALNMDDMYIPERSIQMYLAQLMELRRVYNHRRLYNGKYVNGYCGVTRKPNA